MSFDNSSLIGSDTDCPSKTKSCEASCEPSSNGSPSRVLNGAGLSHPSQIPTVIRCWWSCACRIDIARRSDPAWGPTPPPSTHNPRNPISRVSPARRSPSPRARKWGLIGSQGTSCRRSAGDAGLQFVELLRAEREAAITASGFSRQTPAYTKGEAVRYLVCVSVVVVVVGLGTEVCDDVVVLLCVVSEAQPDINATATMVRQKRIIFSCIESRPAVGRRLRGETLLPCSKICR